MRTVFRRFLGILLVIGLLFIPAVPSNASNLSVDDNEAPELVDLTLDKTVLKPGETGTYTVRFRDENPIPDQRYIRWLAPFQSFAWSYETTKELHDGQIVPGSLSTDDDGVTSFQVQFRVLEDAPYGDYDRNTSLVLEDAKGNHVSVGLPHFKVDDPEHPIDNVPTITGERIVGRTFTGSINAPGAKVELAWRREIYRDFIDVGKGPEIFAPASWYGGNLELTATATWPDGHTLVRREYSGYLQGVEVDLGKMTFDSQPTVGKPLKATFTPNPELPFALPWSEIRMSYSGEQHRLANGDYLPFPASAGKQVRAWLSFRLPTGYLAASEPEVTSIMAPGTLHQSLPNISGTAAVGKTLTADPGTWSGAPDTHTYQWLRNGTPIDMEVFPDYEVVPADAGTTITVQVFAHWHSMATIPTAVSAGVVPVLGSQSAGQLTLDGTFAVGKTLVAKPSGWISDSKLTYQWLRDGKEITGATGSTFALVAGEQGKKVSVRVTSTKPGFNAATKTSASATVATGNMNTGKVAITGTSKVGSKVTAKTSGWTSGSTLKYQWLRDGKAITSATKPTYALVAADRGKKVSVRVTSTKPGFTTTTKTSASATVATGIMTRGKVAITGTSKVGSKVTAKTSGWTTGSTLKYQWLRNGKTIAGSTKSTYKPSKFDRYKKISVRVRASKPGFATTSYSTSKQLAVK
ncbi:hypothetical protein ACFY5D_13170 [Paeniglutamicibacter sp. NPDC012692]|uniref:hypothetical protein n=1 Tax=Paeniglutamicibacter sp. NPDC012692 TaxID=3364388 RepID=UPI0036B79AA1